MSLQRNSSFLLFLSLTSFLLFLTSYYYCSSYFRYFKVDLDKPCPFWEDDGAMCTNEGCSICPCEPNEVPKELIVEDQIEGLSDEHEYGWISRAGEEGKPGGKTHSGSLGKVSHDNEISSLKSGSIFLMTFLLYYIILILNH